MSQYRRSRHRNNTYQPYIEPYYTKKKPQTKLLQFLTIAVICIFFLTGTGMRVEIIKLQDTYPEPKTLPDLIEEEQEEEAIWIQNLIPPIDSAIYMAWDYDPLTLESIPPGINVLAPTWFYIEADALTGRAKAVNLLQQGKTDWNPQQYVELCHANGVKVWGVLSSFIDPSLAGQIVTTPEIQQEVIDQLVEWTRAYNLDGISLDFEKMDPKNKELFTAFAKNIKDALPVGQNTVSAAVTVKLATENPDNWYQCYDRGGLAEVIDYVAVMTYEGHKTGDQTAVAGIDWVEPHVLRILEEVPSNKLILGIPFYGVDFISEVIDSNSFDINPLWKDDGDYRINFFSSNLQSALAYGTYTKNGDTITVAYWLDKGSWNEDMGISQYQFVDTDNYLHTVYIDDESSLYQKGALVLRYNLAGVGIWREGFGYDGMWEALADALS